MTITTTYRSQKNPSPRDGAMKRYVRADSIHDYVWCTKQERSRFDYEQGICSASDIPEDVRAAADALRGYTFSYVDWPQIAA